MTKKCFVKKCGNKPPFTSFKKSDVKYCHTHYNQLWMHGRILDKTIYTKNEFIDHGNFVEVVLCSKDLKEVARAKIDNDDVSKVKKYKWHLTNSGYAYHKNGPIKLGMHNLVMGGTLLIDHINHNKLDNRKSNLRPVSQMENQINRKELNKNNSSGVRGVYWYKRYKKWNAKIKVQYKTISLGYFLTISEAVKARKKAEKKYWPKEYVTI